MLGVCGTHGDGAQMGSPPMMKLVFFKGCCDILTEPCFQVDPAVDLCWTLVTHTATLCLAAELQLAYYQFTVRAECFELFLFVFGLR